MKISIIYDNSAFQHDLKADWGFSCLIEIYDKRILFDTGAKGSILLDNMKELGIDSMTIDEVFISHEHWDHTGGLADFLEINTATVYIPASSRNFQKADEIVRIKEPVEIHKDIFSTGELEQIEQSLVLDTKIGLVIVVGCSHPGVGNILNAAAQFGKPIAIIGGLHEFSEFELIKDLKLVCPTHCTQHISEIKSIYPDKYIEGGAGRIIEL